MLDVFTNASPLLLAGVGLMALSVILAIPAAIILCISGRRLRTTLNNEFGPKRR